MDFIQMRTVKMSRGHYKAIVNYRDANGKVQTELLGFYGTERESEAIVATVRKWNAYGVPAWIGKMSREYDEIQASRAAKPLHCECLDLGCKAHPGKACTDVGEGPTEILYRIDMDDKTGTCFCVPCAEDAMSTGLYTEEAR
jgi:hypothetical protein